jgi:hypothetical protein
MMGNPYMVLMAYAFYIIMCSKILPKVMENRKGFSFTKMLAIADFIVLLRSIYFLVYAALLLGYVDDFVCWRIHTAVDWVAKEETRLCWQFVVSAYVYTLQNVVGALGKKADHPLYIYVLYHHTILNMLCWCGANFYPGEWYELFFWHYFEGFVLFSFFKVGTRYSAG